jgi:hypothetical protein
MTATREWIETTPATEDDFNQGAVKIREHKVDERERWAVDHVWNVSASYDGEHNKTTLRDQLSAPAIVSNKSFIYAKNDGTNSRLYKKDDLDNIEEIYIPVGIIVPYLAGYFTAILNVGYSAVSMTLPDGWVLCNGATPNDALSPIWNATGRCVPDLDDSRFLSGNSIANRGVPGGSNTVTWTAHGITFSSHAHSTPALSHGITQPNNHTFTNPNVPAHYHAINSVYSFTAWGGVHSHTINRGTNYEAANSSPQFVTLIWQYGSGTTGGIADHDHTVTGYAGDNATTNGDSAFATSGGAIDSHSGFAVADHSGSTSGNTGGATTLTNNHATEENRPQYLNTSYIIKIK